MKSAYKALVEAVTELRRSAKNDIIRLTMSPETGNLISSYKGADVDITGKYITKCFGIPVKYSELGSENLIIIDYYTNGIQQSKGVRYE